MILSLYEELCAAQDSARKAGASDAEVSELRRQIINSHRKEATGADYANQWTGARQLPPEPEQSKQWT